MANDPWKTIGLANQNSHQIPTVLTVRCVSQFHLVLQSCLGVSLQSSQIVIYKNSPSDRTNHRNYYPVRAAIARCRDGRIKCLCFFFSIEIEMRLYFLTCTKENGYDLILALVFCERYSARQRPNSYLFRHKKNNRQSPLSGAPAVVKL